MVHDVSDTQPEARPAEADRIQGPPAPGQRVEATEAEARALAEAARQTEWDRPSFPKGLSLGRFDVSLIHPYPRGAAEDVERGEAFLATLRGVCERLDGERIEREDRVPDEY